MKKICIVLSTYNSEITNELCTSAKNELAKSGFKKPEIIKVPGSFEIPVTISRLVKKYEYPMVLNIVLHRKNIEQIRDILDMTVDLDADYVELASTQYYGWSRVNICLLYTSDAADE